VQSLKPGHRHDGRSRPHRPMAPAQAPKSHYDLTQAADVAPAEGASRVANLKLLLATVNGDIAMLAAAVQLKLPSLQEILEGRKVVGSEVATHIEETLALDQGWLDRKHDAADINQKTIDILHGRDVSDYEKEIRQSEQKGHEIMKNSAAPSGSAPASSAPQQADKPSPELIETRIANLNLLTQARGSKVRLARKMGISESIISFLFNRKKEFTNRFTNELESSLGLPTFWMDEPKTVADVPEHTWEIVGRPNPDTAPAAKSTAKSKDNKTSKNDSTSKAASQNTAKATAKPAAKTSVKPAAKQGATPGSSSSAPLSSDSLTLHFDSKPTELDPNYAPAAGQPADAAPQPAATAAAVPVVTKRAPRVHRAAPGAMAALTGQPAAGQPAAASSTPAGPTMLQLSSSAPKAELSENVGSSAPGAKEASSGVRGPTQLSLVPEGSAPTDATPPGKVAEDVKPEAGAAAPEASNAPTTLSAAPASASPVAAAAEVQSPPTGAASGSEAAPASAPAPAPALAASSGVAPAPAPAAQAAVPVVPATATNPLSSAPVDTFELSPITEALIKTLTLQARAGKLTEKDAFRILGEIADV